MAEVIQLRSRRPLFGGPKHAQDKTPLCRVFKRAPKAKQGEFVEVFHELTRIWAAARASDRKLQVENHPQPDKVFHLRLRNARLPLRDGAIGDTQLSG